MTSSLNYKSLVNDNSAIQLGSVKYVLNAFVLINLDRLLEVI